MTQSFINKLKEAVNIWEAYVLPPSLAVHTVQPFVRVSFDSSHAMGNSKEVNFIAVFLCSVVSKDYLNV